MFIRLVLPIFKSAAAVSTTIQQIFIYSGFVVLGVAYFYRLIDLVLVYFVGREIWYLVWIYKLFKYAVEGVLVTVITSIGWGWSLTHMKQ